MPKLMLLSSQNHLLRLWYQPQSMGKICPSNAKMFEYYWVLAQGKATKSLDSRSNYTRLSSGSLLGNSSGRFSKLSWQTEIIRIILKVHKIHILKGHHRPVDSGSPGPGLRSLIQEAPSRILLASPMEPPQAPAL